jgi:hypothetical protein
MQIQRPSDVFQPIQTNQHQMNSKSQYHQSARERLFGNNNNSNNNLNNNQNYTTINQIQQEPCIQQQQQQQHQIQHQNFINNLDNEHLNNRKIAMVKPELRGSCER